MKKSYLIVGFLITTACVNQRPPADYAPAFRGEGAKGFNGISVAQAQAECKFTADNYPPPDSDLARSRQNPLFLIGNPYQAFIKECMASKGF